MLIPWYVWGTRVHQVNNFEYKYGDNSVLWCISNVHHYTICYYYSTFFVCLQSAWTRTRAPPQASCYTHLQSRIHARKHTYRRLERQNNVNNVCVCVQRCCVLHYPIILSGAAAAQAGILTTASGPTCTATRQRGPRDQCYGGRSASVLRQAALHFRKLVLKRPTNNYTVYKWFYFNK